MTVPGEYFSLSTGTVTKALLLGAVAAWVDAVEKFGSGNVTVGDVLAPAIRLAEEG